MPDLKDLTHDELTALGPVEFVALLKAGLRQGGQGPHGGARRGSP